MLDRGGGPRNRRRQICDRCGLSFVEGYTWSGLGMPVMLCQDCTTDLEESVNSYGEPRELSQQRLLARLRNMPSYRRD
jgi:hypothetical protein